MRSSQDKGGGGLEDRTRRLPHIAALDGLRGAAVLAVLVYHSHRSWAPGGYLGVTAFFVLSGFLVVGLLLAERDAHGSIDLAAFWERRARRLAPAVLVLLGLVVVYLAVTHARTTGVLGDAVAAAAWVANWRFIFGHHGYGDLFSQPSPFQHMWSLAIEEQFYLVAPVIVAVVLGRSPRARRGRLAIVLGAVVAASTALCAVFHPAGSAILRSYFGTDTRIAEPAVGALLAIALVSPVGLRRLHSRAVWILDALGAVGLVGLGVLIIRLNEQNDLLYRGGFLLAAVLSAMVIAAGTQSGTFASRVFAPPPLVALGRISYGVYVFHWPVFLALSPSRTGLAPVPLFALQLLVTVSIASASYAVIEQPVRLRRVATRIGLVGWADISIGLIAGIFLVASTTAPNSTFLASGTTPAAPPPLPPSSHDSPGSRSVGHDRQVRRLAGRTRSSHGPRQRVASSPRAGKQEPRARSVTRSAKLTAAESTFA